MKEKLEEQMLVKSLKYHAMIILRYWMQVPNENL